jgi:hypothetical protein
MRAAHSRRAGVGEWSVGLMAKSGKRVGAR